MTDYDYVSWDSAELDPVEEEDPTHLLWGDRVKLVDPQDGETRDGMTKVRGRGTVGWVDDDALGGEPLLELYFIDVGQGDGVLVVTPDRRHIVIDGGYEREHLPTGKNAANFIDWKFHVDYEDHEIDIDAAIATHCDADHYGGLHSLLGTVDADDLDATDVTIEKFYHPGIGKWEAEDGGGVTVGDTVEEDGTTYVTELLGDRASVLKADQEDRLQERGWWATFLRAMAHCDRRDGSRTPFERLSQKTDFLDGFAPGNPSDVQIKVLGPIESEVDGQPALEAFSSDSKTVNGHSVILRLDYGNSRVLLTGDLNSDSQQALLEHYEHREHIFKCDVAKACHHGSSDISYEFLEATNPSVTVVSSGDNESHDHPRPSALAAYALSGHVVQKTDDDGRTELEAPLLYSTELARSVKHGEPRSVWTGHEESDSDGLAPSAVTVDYTETDAGDFRGEKGSGKLDTMSLVTDLVYGLVNVRTDGDRIVCAVMNEKDGSWQIDEVNARF